VKINTGTARDRLFSAAAELIGERGFHGTTVDDIVERAGVAKGTVYYHFKSKEALFDALLNEHFARLSDALRSAADDARTPADALRALVRTELDYIHENQAASKVLMSELWRTDRAWQETLHVLRERYVIVFHDVLLAGVASREFRADLDLPITASALFGLVATTALDWLVFDPERPLEDVAGVAESIVLHAVRA
jgi:TetR/AcrR family transcriptional regulator, cholesterol catabolism regulator